jgi:hypothetical protein
MLLENPGPPRGISSLSHGDVDFWMAHDPLLEEAVAAILSLLPDPKRLVRTKHVSETVSGVIRVASK